MKKRNRKLLTSANGILIIGGMHSHIPFVKDLLASGLTQQALGDLLGKSQAWIGAVLAGKYSDIKWSDGQAIRRLHAERCPQSEHQEAA